MNYANKSYHSQQELLSITQMGAKQSETLTELENRIVSAFTNRSEASSSPKPNMNNRKSRLFSIRSKLKARNNVMNAATVASANKASSMF
jgi:hypothetical protein